MEKYTLGKRKFGVDNQILDKTFSKNNFTKFYSLAIKYRKDEKKLDESILISKELICEDGRITSGLNMFSDDYSDDDTLIVCRLWNGFTKGVDETLDVKEYKGSISKIFEECINFIKRNTRSGFIKMRDGSRLDTESYPELAIREAVVNAIAHRDYSISGTQIDVDIYKNRIEIMSPGAWLLQKSPSMYSLDKIPSIRRNKVICDCFLVVGLMEKSGSGFKKISNLYQGLPIKQSVLESTLDIFKITLYDMLFDEDISEEINSFVSKYDQLILDYCYDIARTRDEIQNYLGYASRSNFTTKILNPLLKRNYLIKTAPNKSKYQKYITNKLKYKK